MARHRVLKGCHTPEHSPCVAWWRRPCSSPQRSIPFIRHAFSYHRGGGLIALLLQSPLMTAALTLALTVEAVLLRQDVVAQNVHPEPCLRDPDMAPGRPECLSLRGGCKRGSDNQGALIVFKMKPWQKHACPARGGYPACLHAAYPSRMHAG